MDGECRGGFLCPPVCGFIDVDVEDVYLGCLGGGADRTEWSGVKCWTLHRSLFAQGE